MPRVLVKFQEGTVVPFESGAVPELSPELLALWTLAAEQFDFLFLTPLAADMARADLRTMVNDARSAHPGETVPDPALVFAVEVPDTARPEPDTVVLRLADRLNALPFVEYAEVEQRLAAAVNRPNNPCALFQYYLDDAPVGVGSDGAWSVTGGDGTGIRVGVLELFDYDRNHRDAPAKRFHITPSFATAADPFADHATAVLGIVAAADNTVDIVGVAPEASIVFASGNLQGRTPALGTGDAFSLINLIDVQLQAGDVLNLSLQLPRTLSNGQQAMLSVESSSVLRTALRLATFRGITCVIAAGNTGVDLDTAGVSFPDSGAVVVGGVVRDQPPVPVSFHVSAHSNTGSRVDCCGWAGELTTLTSVAPATVRTISEEDGGTSIATPMISGVVAAIQGRAKVVSGSPLTPAQVRGLLRDPSLGSDVVPGLGVGVMPDLAAIIPTL
ncbi:S8 family serine peptidase [Streptomyces sp. NPDC002668]|uniref:S8 family serine peptidase n=1 Tax=Streptomyces sp. NPDC002668 TaxID=3154422 RepID=UPI0033243CD6